MSLKTRTAAAVAMTASLAFSVHAQQIAYQADGYTIVQHAPRFCTASLTTARGGQIRLINDNRDQDSSVYFAYARPGFPVITANRTFPIYLQFDGEAKPMTVIANGAKDDATKQPGLKAFTDPSLFTRWSKGKQVVIQLGDDRRTVIDTVSLKGSSAAMNTLTACIHPQYSPTVAPPPAQSSLGTASTPPTLPANFSIRCDTATATYRIGKIVIGKGPECGEGYEPFVADAKRFPSGRHIVLVQAGGGGIASSGSIIMIEGTKAMVVPVDYMLEFENLKSDNEVTIIRQGVVDINGPPCVQKLVTALNWKTGKTTTRTVLSEGACG